VRGGGPVVWAEEASVGWMRHIVGTEVRSLLFVCTLTRVISRGWLVFCEAAGVMILERYEGAVFRTFRALANPQEKGDHEHFPVHGRNGNSLIFFFSNVSSFCLFHFFYPPPSASRMRTCRLNVDRGGLIEGALAVNTQAKAFNRRNLIVDPRVQSRRHPLPCGCGCCLTHWRSLFLPRTKFRSLGMGRSFSLT